MTETQSTAATANSKRPWLIALTVLALLIVTIFLLLRFSDSTRRAVELELVDTMNDIAVQRMSSQGSNSVAAEFVSIPIEARDIAEGIFQASGIGNTHLITTNAGNVLFDSGLATQSPAQIRALEEAAGGRPLTHIIVSHSHADHIGGVKFWRQDDTQIVAHAEFSEEQRYLKELEPYFWHRNRTLFPFIPENPPEIGLITYGGIEPDITVSNGKPFEFELGGREFVVIAAPGAEGADNLLLWLPQEKILFSGDFFGPLFPQFPNVFTMRGEKIRKPVEYIRSLELVMALEPEMIVPSHLTPVTEPAQILADLTRMRDAVQYVHDQTVAGMNAGKSVYELMAGIQLPADLQLSQEHGRVSWAVKSIWEYYATWFHFDRTTELYPVPSTVIAEDIVATAGAGPLLDRADSHLQAGRPVHALHLLEVVLATGEHSKRALNQRLSALQTLLEQAENGLGNSYEIYWLRYRLRDTEERLEQL